MAPIPAIPLLSCVKNLQLPYSWYPAHCRHNSRRNPQVCMSTSSPPTTSPFHSRQPSCSSSQESISSRKSAQIFLLSRIFLLLQDHKNLLWQLYFSPSEIFSFHMNLLVACTTSDSGNLPQVFTHWVTLIFYTLLAWLLLCQSSNYPVFCLYLLHLYWCFITSHHWKHSSVNKQMHSPMVLCLFMTL